MKSVVSGYYITSSLACDTVVTQRVMCTVGHRGQTIGFPSKIKEVLTPNHHFTAFCNLKKKLKSHTDARGDDADSSLAFISKRTTISRVLNCISSIASDSFFCVGVQPSKLLIDRESESGTQVL